MLHERRARRGRQGGNDTDVGRGIGKLQAAVVEALSARGKWQSAQDLAWSLYEPHRKHESETTPYPFYVSVRRAANSLVRRGQLATGMIDEHRWRDDRTRVAYWLPGQESPKLKQATSGLVVENAIMLALSKITEVEAEESFEYGHQAVRDMGIHRLPGDVTFAHVAGRVVKMLARDRWDQERLAVPIHRALYRLQAKGKLTLTWCATRRIGSIRLNGLNVAMKEKSLTPQQLAVATKGE